MFVKVDVEDARFLGGGEAPQQICNIPRRGARPADFGCWKVTLGTVVCGQDIVRLAYGETALVVLDHASHGVGIEYLAAAECFLVVEHLYYLACDVEHEMT